VIENCKYCGDEIVHPNKKRVTCGKLECVRIHRNALNNAWRKRNRAKEKEVVQSTKKMLRCPKCQVSWLTDAAHRICPNCTIENDKLLRYMSPIAATGEYGSF
jgi:Zn finger protein HypA/HybF involved in hydrogenase expression